LSFDPRIVDVRNCFYVIPPISAALLVATRKSSRRVKRSIELFAQRAELFTQLSRSFPPFRPMVLVSGEPGLFASIRTISNCRKSVANRWAQCTFGAACFYLTKSLYGQSNSGARVGPANLPQEGRKLVLRNFDRSASPGNSWSE